MIEAGSSEFWIQVFVAAALVLFGGLMSGLTLGLLSLEEIDLELIKRAGDEAEQRMAGQVEPLIKNQHLLLVTLLLCNAAAMEALPLILDDLVSPIVAVIISVTAVLAFGEIIPQAVCKSYGLAVGAASAPLVRLLLVICSPIAWPIGKVLDKLLGHDGGRIYRRPQLAAILDIHKDMGQLTDSETGVMQGALELVEKRVVDCLTPVANVLWLRPDSKLDRPTVDKLLDSGHSRIPIVRDDDCSCMGVLLVKTLIRHVNYHDVTAPCPLASSLPMSKAISVTEDVHLYDLLDLFNAGQSHMAMVYPKDAQASGGGGDQVCGTKIIGIVTLENVIEELIKHEIVDETDCWVDADKQCQPATEWRQNHAFSIAQLVRSATRATMSRRQLPRVTSSLSKPLLAESP
eukprot:TRINITY_DN33106_c0_g1_i1.p1 TRINITY_DN33106_c0_g1~~TRINITY_DN33106_c0_g1_i1.p1  ORF type:complete len:403 (-),score=74.05 TRINITY_DN33106_c0_g1_i1:27-1235(-)